VIYIIEKCLEKNSTCRIMNMSPSAPPQSVNNCPEVIRFRLRLLEIHRKI